MEETGGGRVMSMTWTKDQQKVIDTRNTNLLVSAAARLWQDSSSCRADSFSDYGRRASCGCGQTSDHYIYQSAAGEMRERISRALAERLKEDPGNEWLQRQEALVHRAQITTIHGSVSM